MGLYVLVSVRTIRQSATVCMYGCLVGEHLITGCIFVYMPDSCADSLEFWCGEVECRAAVSSVRVYPGFVFGFVLLAPHCLRNCRCLPLPLVVALFVGCWILPGSLLLLCATQWGYFLLLAISPHSDWHRPQLPFTQEWTGSRQDYRQATAAG